LFPLMFANSAVVSLMAGEAQEALELATQAVAINPEFWVGYLHLGTARERLGDYVGAIEAYADAEKYSGNKSARASAARAWVLTRIGRVEEARAILDDLVSRSTDQHVPPYQMAIAHAALGEDDAAFEWLERGLQANRSLCPEFVSDERFAGLRADQRFASLSNRCDISGVPATLK